MARETILLVEDDPAVAALLIDLLEDADFAVDGPYGTLAEGVAALADHLPAGAVLDVRLGAQDAGLIADDLDTYGIPYLFCSGVSGDVVTQDHPGAPLVPKPSATRALIPALRRILH
jgi:DNA-binding response OmpR family regulator